jgi:lysine-specific permease
MTRLGELAAFMPTSGSFATYGANYVEPGFGFALGWNYWYNWAVTVAVDLVAAQLVMGYWFPNESGWIWSALFLAIIFGLNYLSVKSYGEAEYWFALIKVATVIIFIITGTLMIFGILTGNEVAETKGLQNWFIGDAPFVGGLPAMIGVAMIVGFSFQGTELIGIAAGESQNPSKTIPSAVKKVFWRILLFYILAILVISLLIPYTEESLLRNNVGDISVSPFTLVFENAGLAFAAALMNAVILTSVLSAGSSGMYASTRMLFALAQEGKAPKFFARLAKNGVPRNALYATTLVAALCFLSYLWGENTLYLWLLNASGMTGFIAWLGIAISHYRFRKGYVAQGRDLADLAYVSGFFPYGPIFAFVLCLLITLGQYYQQALTGQFSWGSFIATYIGLLVFFLVWLGYRLVKKSRWVRYQDMHFP